MPYYKANYFLDLDPFFADFDAFFFAAIFIYIKKKSYISFNFLKKFFEKSIYSFSNIFVEHTVTSSENRTASSFVPTIES